MNEHKEDRGNDGRILSVRTLGIVRSKNIFNDAVELFRRPAGREQARHIDKVLTRPLNHDGVSVAKGRGTRGCEGAENLVDGGIRERSTS